MDYKDGFVAIMADMVPTQLAYAPDIPDEISASGWFSAYSAEEGLSTLLSEIEDDAKATFDAAAAGDLSDHYDSLDDVVRDGVMRARIFEDGTVHLYDTDIDTHAARYGNDPDITADDPVTDRMKMADICSDFGMDPFFPKAGFDAGIQKCIVRFSVIDEDEFRGNFVGPSSDALHAEAKPLDLDEADLKDFFQPMNDGDLGGVLTSVGIRAGSPDTCGDPTWEAVLTVDVANPDLLIMKAAFAGRESGRDDDYVPEDVGDAIFESWFGSNASGSPVDYGLEIIDWGPEQQDPEASNDMEQETSGPGF